MHNLEDKPIDKADSKTEPYPIWGNLARKKENATTVSTFLNMSTKNYDRAIEDNVFTTASHECRGCKECIR